MFKKTQLGLMVLTGLALANQSCKITTEKDAMLDAVEAPLSSMIHHLADIQKDYPKAIRDSLEQISFKRDKLILEDNYPGFLSKYEVIHNKTTNTVLVREKNNDAFELKAIGLDYNPKNNPLTP